MIIVVVAVVRCVALMPVAIAHDVMYHITGQFTGNPDWVAKQEA